MTMSSKRDVTVYLDAADLSRFGDVIRRKGEKGVPEIFERLISLRETGHVRFGYSMSTLSELFQYDERHPETTMAKAEAIERLCGDYAFIYLARLLAIQIQSAAATEGLRQPQPPVAVLERGYGWYPDISGALVSFKDDLRSQLDSTIADRSRNRAERRKMKAHARKVDLAAGLQESIAEFAELWGLEETDVDLSMGALLRDEITPEIASKRLFSAVAQPTKFVHAYFVQHDGPKDLPAFMTEPGRRLQATFLKVRSDLSTVPLLHASEKRWFRERVREMARDSANLLFNHVEHDGENLGLTQDLVELFKNDEALARRLPSWDVFARILEPFILQNMGLQGGGHQPERSAAGDLIHALYLPFTDIWRGDRRFGHLLKQALPEHRRRIVTSLRELPGAIEDRL
ncbi:MAG TPA: hypothetical protein VGC56_04405 [Allosphingosinicella sp.]|jgi:hypothetical protein